MFIMGHRNIVLPAASGSETFFVERGGLVEVPERFSRTSYFAALVKDGKIAIPASRMDKAVEEAATEANTEKAKSKKKN